MKVLFVDHTGLVGGGERSLLGLLDALPAEVQSLLACPRGPLQAHAARRGVRTVAIAESAGSLKLHPLHTPVAAASMASAAAGLTHAARRWQADLLHANSVRAGMIAAPVSRALRLPMVLHVRDCLPPSPLTGRLCAALAGRASAVIAISDHVARAFDPDRRARRLEVIDNPFDMRRLDPARVDRRAVRARLGLSERDVPLALVGQITPWKGQEEAIRALAAVRRTHPAAVLLLVGEAKFVARATRYDNRGYLRRLHEVVGELELQGSVRFLGEREDAPEIMRACELALLPSWEEPFGRTVVEAMAMGVPVVATSIGGPAEVIRDGVDGLLVAPRQPHRLAAAITELLSDASRRGKLGAAARTAAAARFGLERHAAGVSALYRDLLESAPAGSDQIGPSCKWRRNSKAIAPFG